MRITLPIFQRSLFLRWEFRHFHAKYLPQLRLRSVKDSLERSVIVSQD